MRGEAQFGALEKKAGKAKHRVKIDLYLHEPYRPKKHPVGWYKNIPGSRLTTSVHSGITWRARGKNHQSRKTPYVPILK